MSLPVYQNTIVNDRGDVLPEALLRVRTDPGQGNVTLYRDRDGFDALTNVGDVYADTEGFVRFYLPPGVYRMHVVASGYERTYRHVQVAPLKEYNVVSAEQYELAITDAGNNIQFISNNPVSVEIPADEDVEFPMWSEVTLIQAGDGIITLSGDVTIQNPSGEPVKSMGKGSSIKLTLIGGNVWLARVTFDRIIDGDIEQTGDLKITGTITHQGNSAQTGNSNQTGNAQITGRLDVDNLRLDGNTVSSTNSNGHVDITPAGSGKVRLNKDTAVAGDLDVAGDTVLHGNLSVKGTATIIDSTEVDIGDNIIRLNANETGTPTLSAGFEVERGLQANVSFLWDEFNKRWTTSGQPLHISNLIATGSATIGDQTIVPGSIDNWNTAYGWGDHADAGYYSPDNVGAPGKNLLAASTEEEARNAIGAASDEYFFKNNNNLDIYNRTPNGLVRIMATNPAGNGAHWVFTGSYSGGVGLYYQNLHTATTTSREEGGLLVYNQKTGTGLERVLTESDLGGAGDITSGQITDATQIGRAVLTAEDAASARAAIGLQPEITGSATFVHSSNEISLVGIAPALELEIGDVIQVSGSTSNNNLYTVEIINNDNSIVVNYEHRNGAGPLSLTNETTNVTIKRIAKWYSAPLGLGQAWVDVLGSRADRTTYTNPTGRSMAVAVVSSVVGEKTRFYGFVDGYKTVENSAAGEPPSYQGRAGFTLIVPADSSYSVQLAGGGDSTKNPFEEIYSWRELR